MVVNTQAVTLAPSFLQRALARYYSTGARLVGMCFPSVVTRLPCQERRVFLTFDDGPSSELSLRLLDCLREHGAYATFFLTAQQAERQTAVVSAIVQQGHEVGSHAYAHEDFWRVKNSRVHEVLDLADNVLSSISRVDIKFVRPPFGHVRTALLSWCRRNGKRCVLWDVMPGDFGRGWSPTSVMQNTLRLVRPGSIIVLHDNNEGGRLEAIGELLRHLKADGWQVDETIGQFLSRATIGA